MELFFPFSPLVFVQDLTALFPTCCQKHYFLSSSAPVMKIIRGLLLCLSLGVLSLLILPNAFLLCYSFPLVNMIYTGNEGKRGCVYQGIC